MAEKLKPASARGELNAAGLRFAIAVSQFNSFITERLLAGALDGLAQCGADEKQIEIVRVPGSFELPITAKKLAADRAIRFHYLHWVHFARRDIALRRGGVRDGAWNSIGATGYRRAADFLRAYLRHFGAGD